MNNPDLSKCTAPIRLAKPWQMAYLQKYLFLEQIDNHTQNDTNNQHGSNGYEYFTVSSFNMDISRQLSKPIK